MMLSDPLPQQLLWLVLDVRIAVSASTVPGAPVVCIFGIRAETNAPGDGGILAKNGVPGRSGTC